MRSIALLLGVLLSAPDDAAAQGRTITLESFHADIEVRRDASMVVTETLRIRFDGEWNGINRDLSLQHRLASGRRTRLELAVESVTDQAGRALRVETQNESGTRRLRIWVPGAHDATRTVVIRYAVTNGLRFFDQRDPSGYHDELYWNVTGNAWDMPIRSASALVVLPAGVEDVRAWGYTGPAGSTSQAASVDIGGGRVRITANQPFSPFEGLSISVTWAPGIVARPDPAHRLTEGAIFWWPLALPFLAIFFAHHRWARFGRDPKALAIAVQYSPPADLSPAEVGTLVDHSADMKDITSTLVDLAVRGYMLIEERVEKRAFGLSRSTSYVFHLLKPRSDWSGLRPHERLYLSAMFDGSAVKSGKRKAADTQPPAGALETIELDDLKNEFYRHLSKIKNALYDRLIELGHYERRPDHVKGRWFALGIIVMLASVFAAVWIHEGGVVFAGPWPLGASGVVAGMAFIVFGSFMPARTERGARALEAALGFREFLDRVDTPRYKLMITSPEMFEKYLPYAMAFGVAQRWAKAFEGMLVTPPTWYHGSSPGSFDANGFATTMNSLSSQASSAMSSSPSGSSGGGSSGGGSGGGGGSGF